MDRNQNDSREALGYEGDGLATLPGQEMMSFVQDDPMRASALGTKLLQLGQQGGEEEQTVGMAKTQKINNQR